MAELIDGKLVSSEIRRRLKTEIEALKDRTGKVPGHTVIIVGEDPASQVYVRNKKRACDEVGINSCVIAMPAGTSESDLLDKIDELNNDEDVHGILVQLPLPKPISEENVINAISPSKDVDAFHPINAGKIMTGKYSFLPCTPAGVISLLDYYNVDLCGKKCVVLGRSNIVGKPMAHLLMKRNATVTVCHSRTLELEDELRRADLVVVAIGKPEFVKGDSIKDGAVVIDVGINRTPEGKLVGDVHFESVSQKASLITPVPGGVGPMTITTLLENTLTAFKSILKI